MIISRSNISFLIILSFISICFLYLFDLSLNHIINFWTFSQSHLNYSHGFVQRGLFGTIILFLEEAFKINTRYSFAIFFIIIYSLNALLFLIIIYKYRSYKFLLFFLGLSPTLIMFSFNDLGGYQRFDALSIFLMMLHSYFVFLYRSQKINLGKYLNIFNFTIFPMIMISLFVHEIQAWSLFFHFFINFMVLKEKKLSLFSLYIKIIISFLVVIFVFFYPVSQETINQMVNDLSSREIWLDAVRVAARTEGNLGIINYELKTNLFNFYNFKINLFFTLLSILPFNFFMIYYRNKNIISFQKNSLIYLNLSVIPFLSYFAIGDTGRWINLISFTAFSFFAQFPFKKNIEDKLSKVFEIKKVLLFLIIFIYCFFNRLPHCCNLQEKNITIWGGVFKKVEAVYNIYIIKNKNKHYNFDERFKK